MKPTILFVDDEQNILDSFRLLLRPLRAQWDLFFASCGQEALRLMEERPFDVVVSDMRMPGMDGAQLLAVVQQRHPQTVRMILSGYSDQNSVMRTVKLAHQYLSKPCSPEEVKAAIGKALRLRGLIRSGAVRELVARIESLPPLPRLYRRLMGELKDENSSLQKIGDTIGQDVAMSSNILRLVNSAFFGMPTHVSSVHHAVKLLGVETIRVLVLAIDLFAGAGARGLPPEGFRLERLWAHSMRSSCFARAIAEVEGQSPDTCDDCFIAGLLHDLGKLVLATTMPELYAGALEVERSSGLRIHQAERQAFGASHAEVGAYLMGLWGFKDSITEAVCWHHDAQRVRCEEFSPLVAVAAANRFDHDLEGGAVLAQWGADGMPSMRRAEYVASLKGWRALCERAGKEDS